MTTNRLDAFIDAAKGRVAGGFYEPRGPALESNGSLVAAIQDHPSPVIAELKPRSPSEGRLLQGPTGPVLDDFVTGGACAISCLADSDFFDGSPDLVRQAHAAGLPVLWKDFVVDPAQIEAAAHHGASAILLIERILRPDERDRLITAAHEAGLEVLLEVFDAQEAERAHASAADLIGVNARNLDTLDIDLEQAQSVVAAVSEHRPAIALSGVNDRTDRRAMVAAGASAVLVGTALMRGDARLTLRALQRPLAKVCGLRTESDVQAAVDAGADMVGFVVGAPNSPRNLGAVRAQQLSDLAKSLGLRTVLVTPHSDDWEVREWCRVARTNYVQLHGLSGTPEWLHSLGAIPTIPIQVVRCGDSVPDAPFLLDDSDGTGTATPVTPGRGRSKHLSLIAGGLDAATAPEALQQSMAWGADASSALESEPGVKDPERMRRFVEACHGA